MSQAPRNPIPVKPKIPQLAHKPTPQPVTHYPPPAPAVPKLAAPPTIQPITVYVPPTPKVPQLAAPPTLQPPSVHPVPSLPPIPPIIADGAPKLAGPPTVEQASVVHDPNEPVWPPFHDVIATEATASDSFGRMMAKANEINSHHYPYLWGGGHDNSFSGPYDCSGAVSAVLHAGGLLDSPLVSGEMESIGSPGPGRVTLYANVDHVYMSLDGHFFGTSHANPGGGAGWFNGYARDGFVVRHFNADGSGNVSTASTVSAIPLLGNDPNTGPSPQSIVDETNAAGDIVNTFKYLYEGTQKGKAQAHTFHSEVASIKYCDEKGPVR